jgi:hypothetical protein
LLALVGLVGAVNFTVSEELARSSLGLFSIGVFASGFVANGLMMARPKF